MRLGGHPWHAVLSDFPVALWTCSLVWDAVGMWRGQERWRHLAFWSLLVGLATAPAAAASGLADFLRLPRRHPASDAAALHMVLMGLAFAAFAASAAVRYRAGVGLPLPPAALLASLAGETVLLAGGWYGGELVFRYGLGRYDRGGRG